MTNIAPHTVNPPQTARAKPSKSTNPPKCPPEPLNPFDPVRPSPHPHRPCLQALTTRPAPRGRQRRRLRQPRRPLFLTRPWVRCSPVSVPTCSGWCRACRARSRTPCRNSSPASPPSAASVSAPPSALSSRCVACSHRLPPVPVVLPAVDV
jgi:hypothetical protein